MGELVTIASTRRIALSPELLEARIVILPCTQHRQIGVLGQLLADCEIPEVSGAIGDSSQTSKIDLVLTQLKVSTHDLFIAWLQLSLQYPLFAPHVHEFPIAPNVEGLEVAMYLSALKEQLQCCKGNSYEGQELNDDRNDFKPSASHETPIKKD